MRVLFITHAFYPYHKNGGVYNRMLTFVDALRDVEELDMLFYVPADIDISPESVQHYEAILQEKWNPRLRLFLCPQETKHLSRSRLDRQFRGIFDFQQQDIVAAANGQEQLQAFESCLEQNPDLVLVNYLTSSLPILKTKKTLPPVFFDLNDVEHKKLLSNARKQTNNVLTKLYHLQVPSLKKGECQVIKAMQKTFVCSEIDRSYLSEDLGLKNIEVIPNATTLQEFQETVQQPTLLFIGTYSYLPNIQAANYLIEEVFPKVKQQFPDAKLIIAGGSPEQIPAYKQSPLDVEFTGFVDDLTALYARSRVICCPIFSGSGTRAKLLEAGAYGKPIVSTTLGAEGIGLIDQYSFLERNTVESFAQGCIELLQNDSLCHSLGINAYKLIQAEYQRPTIVQHIKSKINQIITSPEDSQEQGSTTIPKISPRITWLLPIKNGMPYLRQTLKSIEDQTYKNYEVLIWDNGSTDGTLEELAMWVPTRIPGRIISDRPLPLGSCLAEMIQRSDTELCARIDADDINCPDRLMKQVTYMIDNPEVAVVGSHIDRINEEGHYVDTWDGYPEEHQDIVNNLMRTCKFSHPAVLLRRSMILEIGNYRDFFQDGQRLPIEDYDLWLRLATRFKLANLPEVLLHYRIHSQSTTQAAHNSNLSCSAADQCVAQNAELLYGCSEAEMLLLRQWRHPNPVTKLQQIAHYLSEHQKYAKNHPMETSSFLEVGREMISSKDLISCLKWASVNGRYDNYWREITKIFQRGYKRFIDVS
jgi:glycosyltransferase involved in cell wall biosynthesis